MIKQNAWTIALLGAGIISMPSLTHAEETKNAVLTSLSATTISGYVDTSAQWNMGSGNTFVPTYSYGGSSKADGFNLNVVKLMLEKPVEPTDGWGAGYKVDLWMGPDANTLGAASTAPNSSDFAVKQAYVALRAPVGNGLDFKVGAFDTIVGYEVSDAPYNPNFTRSYGYTIEPVTHTGALMSYQFCSAVSATAGIANTFGPSINQRAFEPFGPKAESYKTYMGAITLTAPEEWGVLAGSTLVGGVVNGFNSGAGAVQTSWYVGATFNTPVEKLKVGVAYDYAGVSEQELAGVLIDSAYANAVGLYASYGLTEKMTVYARGEYATSDTAVLGPSKVVGATATLQYDLWANVLSRLEFRWDHAADGSDYYGDPGSQKSNSYILMANLAYKF